MFWYKLIITLQAWTIWVLFRRIGYFDGLSWNPVSIKKRVKQLRAANEERIRKEE